MIETTSRRFFLVSHSNPWFIPPCLCQRSLRRLFQPSWWLKRYSFVIILRDKKECNSLKKISIISSFRNLDFLKSRLRNCSILRLSFSFFFPLSRKKQSKKLVIQGPLCFERQRFDQSM
jgi:hypothetical protein